MLLDIAIFIFLVTFIIQFFTPVIAAAAGKTVTMLDPLLLGLFYFISAVILIVAFVTRCRNWWEKQKRY